MPSEYDCKYVDGVLVPRNSGEFEHSYVLSLVATGLFSHREGCGLIPLISVRLRTGPRSIRVPDLIAVTAKTSRERVLSLPPRLVVEIQSQDDSYRRMTSKAAEYRDFGVEHVWVIDPYARVAYKATDAGLELLRSGELVVPGTPIRVVPDELFAKLDKL